MIRKKTKKILGTGMDTGVSPPSEGGFAPNHAVLGKYLAENLCAKHSTKGELNNGIQLSAVYCKS